MKTLKRMHMMVLLIGILPFCVSSGQEIQKRKSVIIIDPGHGGKDSGAIGINNYKEKELVLKVALKMLEWNKTVLNNKYDIYLTRYTDTLISLSHRTKLARVLRPDIFISLHGNDAKNPKAKGIEVFVHSSVNKKGKNGKVSIKMATYIIKQLNEKLGYKSRGVKKANFQVLRQTINSCPSLLVELGFLSNKDEANYLKKEENSNAVALAILMSINI